MIDLGKSGYRAFSPPTAGALLNGYRGWYAMNGIHIGAGGWLHELSGIGIQRFKVSPLTFGEDNVKGERTFTAATDTADHSKLVSRDGDINLLQVVFTCLVDTDDLL